MHDFSFIDEETNIEWTRVDKRIARKAYNNGAKILSFQHKWIPKHTDNISYSKKQLDQQNFDALAYFVHNALELPESTYLDYYIPTIQIPKFYNDIEYIYNDNGNPIKGRMYYLCETPTKSFMEQMETYNTNVKFPKAQSQYAPEQIKPLMFVPYGAYIDYL